MDNPAKHKATIEDDVYSRIKKLTGENFDDIRWWISHLTSLYYSLGEYDGRKQLQKELEEQMNNDR